MDTLLSEAVVVKRPRRTVRQTYHGIDVAGDASAWPAGPLPVLSQEEALQAARKLWRKAVGRAWPGKWELTSGNRYSYPRNGVFFVNPDRGWMQLVHTLSHAAYHRLTSPRLPTMYIGGERIKVVSDRLWEDYHTASRKPHSASHAHLEKMLVTYVIQEGWLDGRLKRFSLVEPEQPKPSRADRNEANVDRAIVRWQEKLQAARKAAVTAEKKLRELDTKKRYYDRRRKSA